MVQNFYPEPREVRQWLQQIVNAEVLVIGDIMLDRYLYGSVARISPEAPIPIFNTEQEKISLGGAGNVARNLAAIGVNATLVAMIGKDSAAQKINALLEEVYADGLKIAHKLIEVPHRPTTEKTRFIANGQQIMRADIEETDPLQEDFLHHLETEILKLIHLSTAKIIIFSDYGKGTLPASLLPNFTQIAKAKNMQVIIDPKGQDYSHYHGADFITPNLAELHLASLRPVKTHAEITQAAHFLMDKYAINCVIATMSEAGMGIVSRDRANPFLHFPAQARAVFDVAGAGDTVVALLSAALAAELDLEQAVMLANLAASVVVAKMGTANATMEEILHAAAQEQYYELGEKIVDLSSAQAIAKNWQAQGEKIGFTNGCFDLIHPGHISLIHQAKAKCGRLIIGLNSDQSVRRLKGETRPIQTQESRALVLAALFAVDLVVIFDETTPLNMIKALRPHYLIKGADYSVEDVVGAKEVQSWGGEVFLADLKQGHSTSNMVNKMSHS